MINKLVSIALLLFLAACSGLQEKEPRTFLCEYYDASFVLTCTSGDTERCKLVCENLKENLQMMDAMKLQMMREQEMFQQQMQSIPDYGHQI